MSASDPPPSPTAPESTRTVAQRLADASVKARIKQALARKRDLRAFDFFPEVDRGNVILRGDVETREQYRHAERIVESLEGVETLTNQVTVAGRPVSEGENATASDAQAVRYHTVQRGDTLWQIAREYNVSVQQLRSLNDLSSSLRPGQRIRVR